MAGWGWSWFLLVLVLMSVPNGFAFNVDVESAVPYRGVPGSMFGFSVAEHRERGSSWVLVGAPEAQTGQPGVSRGGAVYRCDVRRADHCQEIPFDRSGSNNNSQGQQIDDKSNQWFGATLHSSGEDGVVVACAPRYVYFSKAVNRKDPVGTCWVSREDFSQFAEYAPCRTKHWGYHRQGSCQAGLGAAISDDGNRLFIGAPGSWYWQGQTYYVNTAYKFPFVPPRNLPYGAGAGQVHSQSLRERQVVVATAEGPAVDDDSYLGYSVTTGDFDGNGEVDVAVGMPRGSGLVGRVVVYTWNLTNIFNRTGDQMGSYFAYSLCAVDVDGDQLDDLVIGAPLYTHYDNNEGKYETGRVYVIYQGSGVGKSKFREVTTLDGKNSKARFGLALSSLGDVNKDGFGDFAVGAPYDGPRERGAVYIFHGSKDGVMEKASQVIFAEEVNHQLSTFGFSLSGGLDLDSNEYPDLAVGAYEADSAVFFRSRPVVKMTGQVSFNLDSKQISLDLRNCTLRDNTRVPCVPLNAYLKYGGVNVDDAIELEVQFVLDARKPKSPRMFFISDVGRNILNQTVRLDKNVLFQKSMFVYIKPDLRDKLTPLDAEMRYSMQLRRTSSLPPILDQDAAPVQRDSISIQKNCGKDNVCIPDLRLTASSNVSRYLHDSEQLLAIDVEVQNFGEDAFEATYEMKLPLGMDYKRIQRLDKAEREIPVQCSAPSHSNNYTLHCDIGNPLPKEKRVHFKVLLQPFHREGMKARYEFFMAVNSTNPENKNSVSDNVKHINIPIQVDTDLILEGSSHPSDLHYNTTQYSLENLTETMSESEIGPQVVHVYSIRNKGPSGILEAEANFLWPAYTLSGDHLLYLVEQPETSGPVKCQWVEEVNPLRVYLERRGKSFLESIGAAGVSGVLGTGGRRGGEITEEERLGIEQEHREEALATGTRVRQHGGGYRAEAHHEGTRTSAAASSQGGVRSGSRQRDRGGARVEGSYESSYSETAQGGVQGGAQGGYRGTSHRVESEASGVAGGSRRVEVQQGGGYHGSTRTEQVGGVAAHAGSSDAAAGRRTYSHETSRSSNVSWDSQSGGQPRVHSASSWKTEEDGVVRQGSSSTSSYADLDLEERRRYEEEMRRYEEERLRVEEERRRIEEEHRHVEEERRRIEEERRRTQASGHGYRESSFTNYSSSQYEGGRTGGGGAVVTGASHFDGGSRSSTGSGHYEGSSAQSEGGRSSSSAHHFEGGRSSAGSVHYEGSSSQFEGGRSTGGSSYHSEGGRSSAASGAAYGYGASSSDSVANLRPRGGGSIASESVSGSTDSSHRLWETAALNPQSAAGKTAYGTPAITTVLDLGVDAGHRGGHASGQGHRQGSVTVSGSRSYEEEYNARGEARGEARGGARGEARGEARGVARGEARSQVHGSQYSSRSEWSSSSSHRGSEPQEKDEEFQRKEGAKYYASSDSHQHSVDHDDNGLVDPRSSNVQNRFKLYQRIRRDADDFDDDPVDYQPRDDFDDLLECKPVRCVRVRCTVGPLQRDQEAYVALRSRLVVGTVKKISSTEELRLSSMLSSRITRLPHIGQPDNPEIHHHEIFTQVKPSDLAVKPDIVPLWVVILSACAGTLILLLLIFLLYKCGFFKRNRPSSAPEKEPLNRNGHYQSGDEAL